MRKTKPARRPWETYGAVGIWSPIGKECVAITSEPKPGQLVEHREVGVTSTGFRRAAANAVFIVKAANLYDDLVAALAQCERALRSLQNQCSKREWREDWQGLPKALTKAQKVLNKTVDTCAPSD